MCTLKEKYNSYDLNEDFKTLLTEIIPAKYGEDKAKGLYAVCGISPDNLDPFKYRKEFFLNDKDANKLSTDTNANINTNSVVQYQDEVHKGLNKLITYNTLYRKLVEYYDKDTADLCLELLLDGTIFLNDTISFDLPYCYGFDLSCLLEGLKVNNNQPLRMKPVKHSRTFISQFIQLLAVASAELLGACAFPNFFVLLDWFYRSEFGQEYILSELPKSIIQDFQHIIYSVNWNFRRSQTAFTNLSVMDSGFLKEIFGDYRYPDCTEVRYDSVKALSQKFYEYFESIYGKDGVPTFPVMTLAVSLDRKDRHVLDPEFLEWVSKVNHKKSIANVLMTTPDSFSSCCRLKNELNPDDELDGEENFSEGFGDKGFQNSFGVSGVSVGSHRVCGINFPRLAFMEDKLDTILECIHKILLTHRRYLQELIDKDLLPLYSNNLMFLGKQYSTIGFLGVAEYIKNGGERDKEIFNLIDKCRRIWKKADSEFKATYNVEQIPGEMMASRLPVMDTLLGYNPSNFELYANQYVPLTENVSIDVRMQEQAKYERYTSGGSILHISMFDNEPLSEAQYKRILERAIDLGVTYLGVNYCYSVCSHGHTMIGANYNECPVCTAPIEKVYTRVVGFITNVKNWSVPRQHEFPERKSINSRKLEEEHANI